MAIVIMAVINIVFALKILLKTSEIVKDEYFWMMMRSPQKQRWQENLSDEEYARRLREEGGK